VLQVATDPTAQRLLGIPRSWLKDRVDVLTPGFESNEGRTTRKRGSAYYKEMLAFAAIARPEYDTIVVDSIYHIARARYNDALADLGGIPSEYRRENEAPQSLAQYFMDNLWAANQHANIIVIHHAKKLLKSGEKRDLDTYWFDLVGTKIDDTWGAKFDGLFFVDTIDKPHKDRPKELVQAHMLYLKKEKTHRFVASRAGLRTDIPSSVDFTQESESDLSPLTRAWDAIFMATGGSE